MENTLEIMIHSLLAKAARGMSMSFKALRRDRLKNKLDSLFFNRQFESEPQICPDRSREFEILGACHRSKLL